MTYAACVEGFRANYRSLIFLDDTFLKDCHKGIHFWSLQLTMGISNYFLWTFTCEQWDLFIRRLQQILYEVPDPHAPPHQLVFMFDADNDFATILE